MKKLGIFLAMTLCLALWTNVALAAGGQLNVYIWSEYIPDDVVKAFSKETGIKVKVSTYDSNEAMYAKLKMVKGKGYDVVVPSTDFVSRMRKEGMIEKLDKAQIPNFKNLDPKILNQAYDPNNEFSVPYFWGSTALVINTGDFDAKMLQSRADLWRPEFKGKLLLPNDARDVLGIGLKQLGFSINETSEDKIKAAYEKVKTLMPAVKVFNSDAPKQPMLSGEVKVGVMWSGEAVKASQENPKIRAIYPADGASLWLDSLVVPTGAKNKDAAYKFIDYILRPDVAAKICQAYGYATPNLEAQKLLPESIRTNPAVYPSDADLKKGEFQQDVGKAAALYEKYWVKLKTGK